MSSPSTRLEHTGEMSLRHRFRVTYTDVVPELTPPPLFLSSGAVLSLTMGENGDSCYSGGLDGTVRCWKMPDLNVDPYDNYGRSSSPDGEAPRKDFLIRNTCIDPFRSWHREQRAGRPRGQRVGADLLAGSPSPCLVLGRWHHSHLGPSELGSLPVRLQQGER